MNPNRFESLKARQRQEREQYPEALGLRVHRSLSWLQRAEQESDDLDSRFIFLWIAFNAAYASPHLREDGFTEQAVFKRFLSDVIRLDTRKQLSNLVWTQFPHAIRVLLDNPYVFQPFWDAQGQSVKSADWQVSFEVAKQKANQALSQGDTLAILMTVLNRLYTLRNQLLHGGATWNSGVNRDQVRDGAHLMSYLVPILTEILMDHPTESWDLPMYPVVS